MSLPVLLVIALVAWALLKKQAPGDGSTAGAGSSPLYPPGMAPPGPPLVATPEVYPLAPVNRTNGGPVGVADPSSPIGQSYLNAESSNYEQNGPEGEKQFDRYAVAAGGPVGVGLVLVKDALEATIGHGPQQQVGFRCGANSPDPSHPIPCTTAPPTQTQLQTKYRSKSSSNHIVGQK